MTEARKRKLVVLGQTPPPYHGQAVAIQEMIEGLREEVDLVHVPMQFSDTVSENGRFNLKKVTHLGTVIFKTIYHLIRNPGAVVYYPPAPASWVPLIRDLIILSFVRPLCGKIVFQFHAYGIGEFVAKKRWLRWPAWPLFRADLALVMGESSLEDTKHLRPKNVAVVPYGVDVPTPRSGNSDADADTTNQEVKKLRILFVGMHTESKGIMDLLETADLLRNEPVEFRTAGTFKFPDEEKVFEAKFDELQLEGLVNVLGQRVGEELWDEYRQADILFFPTKYASESFGCVVVEAMAHALPVVASDWHGPKDIVMHEQTGLLCPIEDPRAFAEALKKLIHNPELRRSFGQNGYERYRERYTRKAFVHAIREVMNQAVIA